MGISMALFAPSKPGIRQMIKDYYISRFMIGSLTLIGCEFVKKSKTRLGVIALAVAMTAVHPCSGSPAVDITGQTPGALPFNGSINLSFADVGQIAYVTFTVQPKPGSVTRPVSARYSAAYLRGRGYVDALTNVVTLPVFGLYSNYANTVSLTTGFLTGQLEHTQVTVPTVNYRADLHKHPEVLQARTRNTDLSYDFILLKDSSSDFTPIILDTDGEIRWVGSGGINGVTSGFFNNGIYVSGGGATILRQELDGSESIVGDYTDQGVIDFHHNFDVGRDGIITDVDTSAQVESTNIEIDPATGAVLHRWNLADIISAAMTAGGDDPTQFVSPSPDDWFHNNSTTYRASDNTIIISSREDFVIALDYDTQAIKWILGDTTKLWYQFPSLRQYALNLGANTHAPIGQHSVSIVRDRLLLFDDGFPSIHQVPAGKGRSYSAARKYLIDTAANTATETWNYTAAKMISSPICSSVYEDAPLNFLIDYATEGYSPTTPAAYTEILGLNAAGTKIFDYRYPAVAVCGSGWNAQPIHLEQLVFN